MYSAVTYIHTHTHTYARYIRVPHYVQVMKTTIFSEAMSEGRDVQGGYVRARIYTYTHYAQVSIGQKSAVFSDARARVKMYSVVTHIQIHIHTLCMDRCPLDGRLRSLVKQRARVKMYCVACLLPTVVACLSSQIIIQWVWWFYVFTYTFIYIYIYIYTRNVCLCVCCCCLYARK